MTSSTKERIRALNDDLRQHHRGGLIHLTPGIVALGADLILRIDEAVSRFDAFTPDNDPYGEHDFGSVEVGGHVVFFKIDAYDLECCSHSPDPSDPAVTRRVLTLMLADEY